MDISLQQLREILFQLNIFNKKHQIQKKAGYLLQTYYPDLLEQVIKLTDFLDEKNKTLRARLYCILHEITKQPVCKICGAPVSFSAKGGFHTYCPNKISPCASKDQELQQKRIQKIKEKYGVENPLQNQEIRNLAQQTMIEKYGAPYAILSPELKQKIAETIKQKYGVEKAGQISTAIDKRKITNLQKYGTTTYAESQIPEETRLFLSKRENLIEMLKDFTIMEIAESLETTTYTIRKYLQKYNINPNDFTKSNITSISQRELSTILTQHNIDHVLNERTILFPQHLDIYIPSKNIAIELNGVFFHSELSGKHKNYHFDKYIGCKNNGIRLIHVFSSEWNNKKHIVVSKIKHVLNVQQNTVYARNTKIRQLTSKEGSVFFNLNHIQGNTPFSVCYGLFDSQNVLVAAMSFIKSRFNKNYQWELVRYSTKLNYHVVGGAGKLFNHFIKTQNPKNIISYCDLRWGTGNMYEKLGFSLKNITSPNYFYFKRNGDTNKLYSRVIFQKHKLSTILKNYDPKLTEWENMKNNGYDRIWDCGNAVYIWESN